MQTFLPYRSFHRSARSLDRRRLNKQRLECVQIYKALTVPDAGWRHHPAVKMWADPGCLLSFARYTEEICEACDAQELADNLQVNTRFTELQATIEQVYFHSGIEAREPRWLGNRSFHAAHKGNLVRKDTEFYQALWPKVVPLESADYVWPTKVPGLMWS